ncbi:hypothetical protein [Nostoc sp.]
MSTVVTELCRSADYVYAFLEVPVEAKQKGKPIWVADDNQNLETEIIGI